MVSSTIFYYVESCSGSHVSKPCGSSSTSLPGGQNLNYEYYELEIINFLVLSDTPEREMSWKWLIFNEALRSESSSVPTTTTTRLPCWCMWLSRNIRYHAGDKIGRKSSGYRESWIFCLTSGADSFLNRNMHSWFKKRKHNVDRVRAGCTVRGLMNTPGTSMYAE